jgi:hypothetical protein
MDIEDTFQFKPFDQRYRILRIQRPIGEVLESPSSSADLCFFLYVNRTEDVFDVGDVALVGVGKAGNDYVAVLAGIGPD